jgi:hypothetical protein
MQSTATTFNINDNIIWNYVSACLLVTLTREVFRFSGRRGFYLLLLTAVVPLTKINFHPATGNTVQYKPDLMNA